MIQVDEKEEPLSNGGICSPIGRMQPVFAQLPTTKCFLQGSQPTQLNHDIGACVSILKILISTKMTIRQTCQAA